MKSGATYVKTATSLEKDVLEVNRFSESPINRSSQHPLSHLGAGRFWSPTKEPDSWIKRIWQPRRDRRSCIAKEQFSPGKSHECLLAGSVEWLEEEYPMHPAHLQHISDSYDKTESVNSYPRPGEANNRLQQQPPRRSPGAHDSMLSDREKKTRRQLEMIRQEDESTWTLCSRIVELDSTSLGTAELDTVNHQGLPSSHTHIPGHCLHETENLNEQPELEAPASGSSVLSTLDPLLPACCEESKVDLGASNHYILPETNGTLHIVDPSVRDALIPIEAFRRSCDSSGPIPVSEDCSGTASQSSFAELDRILQSRRSAAHTSRR
ncbi:MAG: hypothetical protein Q9225_003617 [Loekoesia sp. 1 TL-2023]